MLKRVHVQGYKCLRDVSVELGPLNVLVGESDSGKSSFLQAIAEPSRALMGWQPTDVSDVSDNGWSVDLEGAHDTLRYDARHFSAPKLQAASGHEEQLKFSSSAFARSWFGRHREFSATDPVSLDATQVAAHSPAATAVVDSFVASRGAGTAAHLASLALGDRDRFDAIEAALRGVTKGRIRSVVVRDIGHSTYTLAFKLFDGRVVPATQMSHGILLYVGFLALIQRDPLPGMLLLEEPERGMHPLRYVDLIGTLRALSSRGTQIVVTTSSPHLLSACLPGEVRVFQRPEPESPTEVHVLASDWDNRSENEPLGELWAARGEAGLLAPR
jgi:predicted ATPase